MSVLIALLASIALAVPAHAQTAAPVRTPAQESPREAQATTKPRVRLVATGGTIANRTGGRLSAEELVASIPGLGDHVAPEHEQFTNLASSALSLEQWLQLAQRLNAIFSSRPDLSGLVVTSGTDTLEELAYFLHLTVRDERPVVVVGSMRNPNTLGYEGAANLLEGFRVAADPGARGLGTLVVLNDEVNAAREVTKTDALRLQTFQTRGYGVLGVVDRDRVAWYRRPVKRGGARSEFDISGVTTLPRVDVLLVYQGASGDLIRAAADNGARGIVIASAGAGATSGTQREGMLAAAAKGAVIVVTTRAGSGRIGPRTAETPDTATNGDQGRDRPIGGEDLAPVKARILLMLALTKTSDRAELQRMFSEY